MDETSGISLDELSVRPATEAPVEPAFAQILFDFHLPVLRF